MIINLFILFQCVMSTNRCNQYIHTYIHKSKFNRWWTRTCRSRGYKCDHVEDRWINKGQAHESRGTHKRSRGSRAKPIRCRAHEPDGYTGLAWTKGGWCAKFERYGGQIDHLLLLTLALKFKEILLIDSRLTIIVTYSEEHYW